METLRDKMSTRSFSMQQGFFNNKWRKIPTSCKTIINEDALVDLHFHLTGNGDDKIRVNILKIKLNKSNLGDQGFPSTFNF